MAITWKDGITTVLAVASYGLYYAMSNNIRLPIVSGYRVAVFIMLLIGVAMCAFSSPDTAKAGSPFISIATVLGITSLALVVYGLITGSKDAFMLLTFVIIVLWIVATLRHLIGA